MKYCKFLLVFFISFCSLQGNCVDCGELNAFTTFAVYNNLSSPVKGNVVNYYANRTPVIYPEEELGSQSCYASYYSKDPIKPVDGRYIGVSNLLAGDFQLFVHRVTYHPAGASVLQTFYPEKSWFPCSIHATSVFKNCLKGANYHTVSAYGITKDYISPCYHFVNPNPQFPIDIAVNWRKSDGTLLNSKVVTIAAASTKTLCANGPDNVGLNQEFYTEFDSKAPYSVISETFVPEKTSVFKGGGSYATLCLQSIDPVGPSYYPFGEYLDKLIVTNNHDAPHKITINLRKEDGSLYGNSQVQVNIPAKGFRVFTLGDFGLEDPKIPFSIQVINEDNVLQMYVKRILFIPANQYGVTHRENIVGTQYLPCIENRGVMAQFSRKDSSSVQKRIVRVLNITKASLSFDYVGVNGGQHFNLPDIISYGFKDKDMDVDNFKDDIYMLKSNPSGSFIFEMLVLDEDGAYILHGLS